MTAVPATLEHLGHRFEVRRAWPNPDRTDRVSVELLDTCGRIRGGWWSPSGLELYAPGCDPALPALSRTTGEVVSHRPGKRVVVRTDDHWVKAVRPGKERRILAAADRAVAFAGAFRMPQIVNHSSGLVVSDHLVGRSLADGRGWSDSDWERAWSAILLAWSAAGGAALSKSTGVHDAGEEVGVLRRWHTMAPPELLASGMDERIDRVADALLTGHQSPLRISHRDLHDQQLVWDPVHGPGLLDIDTVTVAEAALDLGNLRAHSRWRVHQGHWSTAQASVVQRMIDLAAARADISPQRLSCWETAALLRLVCVHLHRPADRDRVSALVELTSSASAAG